MDEPTEKTPVTGHRQLRTIFIYTGKVFGNKWYPT